MTERDDESRIRILEAYDRAKKVNPGLTQGQFMMRGAPGSSMKGAPGRFKNEETAARYFRKLKTGERTGGAMYRDAKSKARSGNFQVRYKMRDGQYYSENITVYGGRTSFDLPAVEDEFRKPENFNRFRERLDRAKSKYDIRQMDVDPGSVDFRATHSPTAPIRMRMTIE